MSVSEVKINLFACFQALNTRSSIKNVLNPEYYARYFISACAHYEIINQFLRYPEPFILQRLLTHLDQWQLSSGFLQGAFRIHFICVPLVLSSVNLLVCFGCNIYVLQLFRGFRFTMMGNVAVREYDLNIHNNSKEESKYQSRLIYLKKWGTSNDYLQTDYF